MSNRREFITLVGGAAAWPLVARAQQAAMPVIGSLTGHSRISFAAYLSAFQRGLADMGFVEGRNLAIPPFRETVFDRACRRWRPIWFAARSPPCWSPAAAHSRS
jgi:hypothetical protein